MCYDNGDVTLFLTDYTRNYSLHYFVAVWWLHVLLKHAWVHSSFCA